MGTHLHSWELSLLTFLEPNLGNSEDLIKKERILNLFFETSVNREFVEHILDVHFDALPRVTLD